jgi:hypothetical protein
LLSDERLFTHNTNNYADSAKQLLDEQKNSWEMCRNGYKSLNSVEVRRFDFEGYYVNVQFNPGRIISSSAKVDPKTIRERKCFLCMENLPPGQKGIIYKQHYIILCNPFPIFPEHFTIPSLEHKPQQILYSFRDFLDISRDLSDRYIVFYNGPKCGASAPDHFHFQAGNKNFMPIVEELTGLKEKFSKGIFTSDKLKVQHLNDGLRKLIIIEGEDPAAVERIFDIFYQELEKISVPGEEPMMNIISVYEKNKWNIVIILREKHRPARFFEEGDNNLLLSPAAVDLGGVCITPLEKDFRKITKKDIEDIFGEVILNDEKFLLLVKSLKKRLLE